MMKSMWEKLSIFVGIFIFINIAVAQFGADVRVDDASPTWGCLAPTIMSGPDSTLYVAWQDDRLIGYRFKVYFSKSTDGGNTWTPDVRVDDSTGIGSWFPCLTIDSSGILYCVWHSYDPDGDQIRLGESTNAGETWTPSVRVDNAPDDAHAAEPDMLLNDSNEILVVWASDSAITYNWKCYFSKSSDGGNTWSSDVGISSYMSNSPKLVANADTLYTAYNWRAFYGAQTDIYPIEVN